MMKRLFLFCVATIFLLGFISASTEVLTFPTATSNTSAQTIPSGAVFNVTTDGITLVVVKNPYSTGTTASLYIRTGVATGTHVENATFSGDNATFSTPLSSSNDYIVVIGTPSGSYNRVENGSIGTFYTGFTSNPHLAVWRQVRLSTSEFTDQLENLAYFFTNDDNIGINMFSPVNDSVFLDTDRTFIFNVTDDSGIGITNATLLLNGTANETNSSGFEGNYSFNVDVPLGYWNWSVEVYGDNGQRYTGDYTWNFTNSEVIFYDYNWSITAIEQTSTTLTTNLTLQAPLTLSSANITYNQTNYTATFSSINATSYYVSASVTTPEVNADTNITFNWTIALNDSSLHISGNNQQSVQNFGIDFCSANTIQIFNFTMVDEDVPETIIDASGNQSSLKVDLELYPNASKISPSFTFSHWYNATLPARVCVNDSLGNSVFYTDFQVTYDAVNWASESYNVQNYSLNASSNPSENITLYDLSDDTSQAFTITYKDDSFLAVPNAIIQVQRKYVDEGLFRVVEAPLTDVNGEAVAHLVIDDAIYSFNVVKQGQLLATFSNVYALCQNPSINNCEINLNSFASNIPVENFASSQDFSYTLTYDNDTRIISSTFTIPSGAVSWVTLNVTTSDALGTSVCNQAVTTSAGTLNCDVGTSFGNSSVIAKIYKDGNLIAQGTIKLDQDPRQIYGGAWVFIALLVSMSLFGVALSDNPMITGLLLIVGIGLLFALNVVANNGFIGGTSTILYIITAIVLVLIKGSKRS